MSSLLNYAAHSPDAFKSLLGLDKTLKSARLPHGLAHLIRVRASQLNGCIFCLDMHSKEAKRDDEREIRLYHLAAYHESPLFTAQEKAALHWVDALTAVNPIADKEPLLTALRQHFNDDEISDMTLVIGLINLWNRLGIAFKPTPGSQDKFLGLDKLGL